MKISTAMPVNSRIGPSGSMPSSQCAAPHMKMNNPTAAMIGQRLPWGT